MSEYAWIKSYPNGVRYDRELTVMPVWQILANAVRKWPDNAAIEFMGKRLSYGELGHLVHRAAVGFRKLGVRPGVHVGLFLPNTPHYVICFFGILEAGGTVVNYSPLDTLKTLQHKIEDSETDIMVTLNLTALYPQMEQLLERTRLRKLVIADIGKTNLVGPEVAAHLAKAGQLCEVPSDERHVGFEELMANDGAGEPEPIANLHEAVAVLQYTGGTTGEPKGAMLTHANVSSTCAQYWETANGDPKVLEEGRDRVLVALPLFHIYALSVAMLFAIRIGAEMVLHMRFEVEAVIKDLAAKKVSVFPGVPTMFAAIINYPDIAKYDLSSLKFCGSGGAPLPLEVQEQFQRLTGCRLVEGWGMTETCPAGTFTPVHGRRKRGSCGMPMPGVLLEFVSIEDPSVYVPLGARGELCISGPNVMKGYWKKPEATASSMTAEGLFRTGDVGYMDEDGFVYIVDRIKDMLVCGGYNVYPRNIEEAIYEHPSVAEVCVIGIHDEYRGQSPKAFIKLKAGAPEFTLDELKAFLKERLGKHEMVQALAFRAELPRTLVGKLSKKELYEEEARRTR